MQPLPAQAPDTVTANALYRAAYAAYGRGDLAAAHVDFAKLVKLAPKVAVGHAAYGEVLLMQGEAAAALEQLEIARKLDPGTAPTLIAIGRAQLALGQSSRAIDSFRGGLAAGAVLSPEESESYATALAANGQLAQALSLVKSALESPAPPLTGNEIASLEDALGTLLARSGEYQQASRHFTAAIAAAPGMAAAHAHLGSAALAMHQTDTAVDELRQAVVLAPAELLYAVELGRALSASRQDEEAISLLRQALQKAGQAPAAARSALFQSAEYALALALQAGGLPKESLPLFADYTKAHSADAEALTNYALALVQTGDAKQAILLYQQALTRGPDNATLREDYGVAYLQQSGLDHALEQFQAGLALEPENPHLHYDLGLAYKLKDNLAAAIPELEKAEQLDPTLPDPAYTLGVIHMQQGEFAVAAAELEKTVVLQPANGAAWAVLGNVYKERGDAVKSAAALRRAIELDPGQPSTHISLASILAQGGDKDGAAAERKQAAELSRVAVSRQRASFALKSGQALMEQGKLKEAEAQLRTAVAAYPQDPVAHQVLAETLAREGQSADAALERQQAAAVASGTAAGKTSAAPHAETHE